MRMLLHNCCVQMPICHHTTIPPEHIAYASYAFILAVHYIDVSARPLCCVVRIIHRRPTARSRGVLGAVLAPVAWVFGFGSSSGPSAASVGERERGDTISPRFKR